MAWVGECMCMCMCGEKAGSIRRGGVKINRVPRVCLCVGGGCACVCVHVSQSAEDLQTSYSTPPLTLVGVQATTNTGAVGN